MSNNLMESDDNNFEIKKYKFNPVFKDKYTQQNTEKIENPNKNKLYKIYLRKKIKKLGK